MRQMVGGGVQLKLDVEGSMLEYCPMVRRGEEMLHQKVKFSKFWVTGSHKKKIQEHHKS